MERKILIERGRALLFINPKTMGKTVICEQLVDIPEGVEFQMKGRLMTVTGPLGKLQKTLPRAPVMYKKIQKGDSQAVSIRMYFAGRRRATCVGSLAAHIKNGITGVTKGFKFQMKYGYKRHPMRPLAAKDGKSISIALFLGAKDIRTIPAPEGVTISTDENDKDKRIFVEGLDIEKVGSTCGMIHQSCVPTGLDRRKFMDGIYLQERLHMVNEEE